MTTKTKVRTGGNRTTAKIVHANHSIRSRRLVSRLSFKRERLPSPADYYKGQGMTLIGGGKWKSALCPFHNDTKPSLRILIDTGFFCCMACAARGDDVLDFHRMRYGLGFIDAAKALGAMEDK